MSTLSRDELLARFRAMAPGLNSDPERDHQVAEDLLLEFIGDPEITAAFMAITKWYA